jgi:hypothetical protein
VVYKIDFGSYNVFLLRALSENYVTKYYGCPRSFLKHGLNMENVGGGVCFGSYGLAKSPAAQQHGWSGLLRKLGELGFMAASAGSFNFSSAGCMCAGEVGLEYGMRR